MLKKLLLLSVMLLSSLMLSAHAESRFVEGQHYVLLPERSHLQEDGVLIEAVFSYTCPHCASLEPLLNSWMERQDDMVRLKHLPLNTRNWALYARTYYVLEVADRVDDLHQAMFDAMHLERRRMGRESQIAEFLAEKGLARDEFDKLFNSFAVDSRLRQGDARTRAYAIDSVPTLVINGKYKTSAPMAGSVNDLFALLDHLVEQEQSAH